MPPRPQPHSPTPSSAQALRVLLAGHHLDQARASLSSDPGAFLYAGLGLAGRAMSQGLAIDVLSLLALAEHLRRASGTSQVTVLIADTNAIAAGFPQDLVDEIARDYLRQTKALCAHMNAKIEVTLASTWDLLASPVKLPRAAMMTAPYVRVQLEQMRALFSHGYRIKVGWRMPGAKRDEEHFDRLYREHLEDPNGPHRLQTIYGLAGRSFEATHPRACPYVTYQEQKRIMLTDTQSVREQIRRGLLNSPNATRGYRRHLIKLARGLRPLVDPALRQAPALDLLDSFRLAAQGKDPTA